MMALRLPHIGTLRVLRHPAVQAGWIACLVALAIAVLAAAWWWPAHRASAALEQQVDAARRALVDARRAHEVAARHAHHLQVVPQLEARLAAAADQTLIVESLGRLARQHGLRIVSQHYAARTDPATGEGLVIELGVEGPYRAARGFLHGVAALPVWIDVHEVQLDRGADAGSVRGRLRMASFRKGD